MGWNGFGAVTILVTKRRFWPFAERRGSRNLLIPWCPGRDSNPHEGNPHRILSPVRFFVGRARMKMTGPRCSSISERAFDSHQNTPFQFRAQFWAQLADFRLFRATSYFCNVLMYRELAWFLGRDLNPRPLGSSPKGLPFHYASGSGSRTISFIQRFCSTASTRIFRSTILDFRSIRLGLPATPCRSIIHRVSWEQD